LIFHDGKREIERFVEALGLAAIDLWSELPQEISASLFDRRW